MEPQKQVINEPQEQDFNQLPLEYETKSALPVVVGVIFCIFQVFSLFGGLLLLLGGALIGGLGAEAGDSDVADAGAIVGGMGVMLLVMGIIGIYSGVMIAQRKKLGVQMAWGLLGLGAILSIGTSVMLEQPIDPTILGCNGICAVLVGLPLMVGSASQHME